MNNQKGFTLIEISIVLVIIGLILGAVLLRSGSVIGNTKATSTIALIKDLNAATNDFKSRYHYLPGDLPKAGDDIPGVSVACNIAASTLNIGNGLIDTSAEKSCVAEHLVLVGFIKGSATGIVSPFNGGATPDVFVLSANTSAVNVAAVNPFPPTVQNVIEIQGIPCDAASTIDSKIDDGIATAGNVMYTPTPCTNGVTTLDVAL